MSIAGAINHRSGAALLRSENKTKARIPTDFTELDAFKPSINQALEDEHPFFVYIDTNTGVLGALNRLNQQLNHAGKASIFSKKEPVAWIGHELTPGVLGLINHGGLPKLLTKPGRYPPFPFRNWWAREYCGSRSLSDTVVEFQGLTIVQVSQNQVAVISNPQNNIFVLKNAGFVAFSLTGGYNVLSIIDQAHLDTVVKDDFTSTVLGWTQEVKMRRNTGSKAGEREFVVALFLNIPVNNCAILQKGDDLELLPAGQHHITDPNTTLRGMFTCCENELEISANDLHTRDQVPVALTINLKWQLIDPLKLITHGYNTPYGTLRDKAQSVLTRVVSHLDCPPTVKQRSLGPSNLNGATHAPAAFLGAVRTIATVYLDDAVREYGIVLKNLAVVDCQFGGEIARTTESPSARALQAQVEAAKVGSADSNKAKVRRASSKSHKSKPSRAPLKTTPKSALRKEMRSKHLKHSRPLPKH